MDDDVAKKTAIEPRREASGIRNTMEQAVASPGLDIPTYIGRLIDPSVGLIHSRDMTGGGCICNNRHTKHAYRIAKLEYICVSGLFGVTIHCLGLIS